MQCLSRIQFVAGLLFTATVFNAHANLTSYTGTDGAGLVYSSVSNVTWTQDANLLGSMEANPVAFGYFDKSDLINAIILANSVNGIHGLIADTANSLDNAGSGLYHLTAADFGSDGMVNWWGAQAFVGFLNSIDYGGSKQWRLPTANGVYGINGSTGNELGQLYYEELKGTFAQRIPDTATFNNEQAYAYWTGTEYLQSLNRAWVFNTIAGLQFYTNKDGPVYAWAVSSSPEHVSAVPLPSVAWFFLSGLTVFWAVRRPSAQKPA